MELKFLGEFRNSDIGYIWSIIRKKLTSEAVSALQFFIKLHVMKFTVAHLFSVIWPKSCVEDEDEAGR